MLEGDDETPIARRNFLQGASVAGAAMLTPTLAGAGAAVPTPDQQPSLVNPEKPVPENTTADEIRSLLKLEPNATCGFVREIYKSDLEIKAGGLPVPFQGGRPLGSALYFMVTPEAPVKLHRIKSDRLYHYYLGDPIEVLLLHEGGTSELVVVGPHPAGRRAGAAFHPRRHVSHRARHRKEALVSRREHRMAWRRSFARRRDGQHRGARGQIS